MEYDFEYEVVNHVARITLDRPRVLNALTLRIYRQLVDLFQGLTRVEDVKAVVITGRGKEFCSGGDVKEIIGPLIGRDVRDHLEFTRMTGALVVAIRLFDKPVIAAINGLAAGAGAVIALAADMRIASPTARFAFLFTKVGLTGADMGAAYLLPRIVGMGRASEMLLLGNTINATTAERYGLINRLVQEDQLLETSTRLAERLANGPSLAISMTKRMINNEMNMDLASAIEAEAQAQALLMMGEDHRRFYAAFKKKEKPRFTGR